ncbi:hypothetical protein AWJ20_957 [Sugiyamaella lignohabitans]|uniref:NAD(P)-binding domain-containing protein n=1 Tax=Sugiyamaella lignohabitans TaxID=796027 RepID=A0A167DAS1_9ASCO|nr:uncharacterized protein AWJ20_957 [Sugiyamaella lignohabitans]ANB12690.1 hypothetical protein AWJ20_957 [Sugiyamaella lignohabitans]
MFEHNIDTIIHLAAESHVDHSFGNPYQFTLTNALGTQVILEAAKKFKVTRLLHMSTDEVYGEVSSTEKDLLESSILMPTNPYAASKASGDLLVSAYVKSFNLPAVTIRCNNVYGPHQFPEKIIPKFICLLNRGEKCFLHGDGTNTRRYLYAADAVSAIDTVLHKGEVGHIYNAGSNDELSNLDILKFILKVFGVDSTDDKVLGKYTEFTEDRPFNDSRYAIDSEKLQKLGWTYKTSFEDGLKVTTSWYSKYGEIWWGDVTNILKAFPDTLKTDLDKFMNRQ